jgi:hypothetical protein
MFRYYTKSLYSVKRQWVSSNAGASYKIPKLSNVNIDAFEPSIFEEQEILSNYLALLIENYEDLARRNTCDPW